MDKHGLARFFSFHPVNTPLMSKLLYCGIDVSKGHADVVLLDHNGKPMGDPLHVYDHKAGHTRLRTHLLKAAKNRRARGIILLVESTGGYEEAWLRCARHPALRALVTAVRLNPVVIHYEYKVQRHQGTNDRISALTIARHAFKEREVLLGRAALPAPAYRQARERAAYIAAQVKKLTRLKSQLDKTLAVHLPGFLSLKSESGWADYLLRLLGRYGSKQGLLRAAAKNCPAVKGCGAARSAALARALRAGSGAAITPAGTRDIIRETVADMRALDERIGRHKKNLLADGPVPAGLIDRLCTLPNLGGYAAMLFALHVEQIDRYDSAAKVASLFGMHPTRHASGDKAGPARLSKQGNAGVRCVFYNVAARMLMNDEPHLRGIYDKHRLGGMSHDAALCVVAHKIVRILYGMWKTGTTYQPRIDRLNQQRRVEVEVTVDQEEVAEKAARQQALVEGAPVSKRYLNKHKKDYKLQAAKAESTESS